MEGVRSTFAYRSIIHLELEATLHLMEGQIEAKLAS